MRIRVGEATGGTWPTYRGRVGGGIVGGRLGSGRD